MPTKVKRGLGLLVLALLGWILGWVLTSAGAADSWLWPIALVGLIAAVVLAIGGLVGGLVLIAWGLLRD